MVEGLTVAKTLNYYKCQSWITIEITFYPGQFNTAKGEDYDH